MKSVLLASACVFGLAAGAAAQNTTPATTAGPGSTAAQGAVQGTVNPGTSSAGAANGIGTDVNEILVTATKRSQALSSVPIAVSAVTAEGLQNSGATDIRQLNQLSPSLFVSSSTSEAGASAARIRGIGTIGTNPGLESSVATFIDGVYRSRSGVGLTELGEVDRIEVLRGPQGTLFGRNASAGLINIITKSPSFETAGGGDLTYGNYNAFRVAGSLTGPIVGDAIAARIDGVYSRRDGFVTDVISGRSINNRDRFLVRGQLLLKPTENLSVRIIGDYAERHEECCAAVYLPFRTTALVNGNVVVSPVNPVVNLLRSLGAVISDNTGARTTSVTPGRNYASDVRDTGVSGEINYDLGFANLTSITAYRDYKLKSGQDADFTNLDILYQTADGAQQRFKTFSQELRLQGRLFDDKLDYLVGGYFADEKLTATTNFAYGADYDRFANGIVGLSIPGFPGFGALRPFTQGFLQSRGVPAAAAAAAPVASLVANLPPLAGSGINDRFNQDSRNYAFFTHDVFNVTDRVSVTVGVRYTNERKAIDANLTDNNAGCTSIRSSIARLNGLAGTPLAAVGAAASGLLTSLSALPCVLQSVPGGSLIQSSSKAESKVTGTAVIAYKPIDQLLTYGSYSKGYKAGGFNLDRSGIVGGALDSLQFQPETVDAFEVGAKLNLRQFKLNAAIFHSVFNQFQLNTFNGINFIVANIQSCRDDLNGGDRDFQPAAAAALTGACPSNRVRGGVVTQGVELEAFLYPAPDVSFNLGFTYADTKYRNNLTDVGGRPLTPTLFDLPGKTVSNAPKYVVTGAATFNPAIGGKGYHALGYVDFRYQSGINTGSDLFSEKVQPGFVLVNARIGLQAPASRVAVELFVQNLFNETYQQFAFAAPAQGSGTIDQVVRGGPTATTVFSSFLGEPRTFGITLRGRF